MKIGVKFCGGCNPKYDRGACLKTLKEQFSEALWVSKTPEEVCDYWMIICGCERGCVDSETYGAGQKGRKLYSPSDFLKAKQEIQELSNTMDRSQKKILHINEAAELTRKIYRSDLTAFAQLTMDHNRLHTDVSFAAEHEFQKPVVHGMFTMSLLSAVMGTKLPGDGTVLMGCQTKFLKPVYPEDEITARVCLKQCRDFGGYYIAKLSGICRNQKGELVTEIEAVQKLDRKFFQFEKEINYDKS